MKKVIVTGAGGYIGGTLTDMLLDRGIQVIGVDVSESALSRFVGREGFTPVIADFTKYSILHELIEDDDIDVFYHFAWQGVFGDAFKDHSLQLSNACHAADAICEAVKIGCKKFVFAGTVNEYEALNFFESNYCEPRYTCIYATSKMAAELVCKTIANQAKIEYCTGIIPMIYGGTNNRSRMVVNVVLSQMIKGITPKLIEGEDLYDFVSVGDIAEGFIAIGEKGKPQKSYYIGHRELKRFKDWITEMRDIVAPGLELKFGEYPDNLQIDFSKIDLDLLYNDTGFECRREMKNELPDYIEWVKQLDI